MEVICNCTHRCLELAWRMLIVRPVRLTGRCFRAVVDILMLPPRGCWLLCVAVALWALRKLQQLIYASLDLEKTKEKLKEKENVNEGLKEVLKQAELKIGDLSEQCRGLQQQKDDALSRLSKLMSLKLRDGNPNVVDLSDEYRPTKLAELSGELYDNEWTTAYEFLETNTELKNTSEQQRIQFLLDILLGTFELCTKACTDEWKILVSTIRGDNAEIKKEDEKMLKDLRKKYAIERLQDIEKKCLKELELRHQSQSCFKSEEILQFVQGCVKLCWLMQFQDPPVVFACPEWNSRFPLSMASPVSMDNGLCTPDHALQPKTGQDESEPDHQDDPALVEIICETSEPSVKAESSHGTQIVPKQCAETSLVSGTHIDGKKMAGQAAARSRERRIIFDTGLFKDFTRKGKFIDFIVWPIIYLHEGGPILSKGVAQGCD